MVAILRTHPLGPGFFLRGEKSNCVSFAIKSVLVDCANTLYLRSLPVSGYSRGSPVRSSQLQCHGDVSASGYGGAWHEVGDRAGSPVPGGL